MGHSIRPRARATKRALQDEGRGMGSITLARRAGLTSIRSRSTAAVESRSS